MRNLAVSFVAALAVPLVPSPAIAQSVPPGYDPQPPAYPAQPSPGVTLASPPIYDNGVGYTDLTDDAELYGDDEQPYFADPSYVDDGYDPDAYSEFEAQLDPYGQWTSTPDYGMVWTPSAAIVGADFSPYGVGGHWALTEFGWTWVSDWDWGWAPFHYGRWATIGSFGWCWIPGRIWGPAWVSWRFGGGYAGWAPLGPHGTVVPAPPPGSKTPWRFTTTAGLTAARPTFVGAGRVHEAYAASAPLRNIQTVNRARVEAGPAPHLVASAVGHPLTPTSVHQISVAAPRSTIVPRLPGVAPRPSGIAPRPAYRATTIGPRATPWTPPSSRFPSTGAVASATPWHGSSVVPSHEAAGSWRSPAASPWHAQPATSWQHAPAATPWRAPSTASSIYRGYAAAPAYHSSYAAPYRAPSTYSAPAYRAPSTYSAPAYHAGPAFHASAPAAASSSPSWGSSPAPVVRPSSGGFHGGAVHFGGGGGFHFGGHR